MPVVPQLQPAWFQFFSVACVYMLLFFLVIPVKQNVLSLSCLGNLQALINTNMLFNTAVILLHSKSPMFAFVTRSVVSGTTSHGSFQDVQVGFPPWPALPFFLTEHLCWQWMKLRWKKRKLVKVVAVLVQQRDLMGCCVNSMPRFRTLLFNAVRVKLFTSHVTLSTFHVLHMQKMQKSDYFHQVTFVG